MKRIFAAGLLALPLLLAGGSTASAQCASCGGGFAGLPGYSFGSNYLRAGTGYCGGTCSRLFPHIHQHGPLVNYGPYQGYYPFEPYGPWTSDLRYNAPPCKHWGDGLGGLFGNLKCHGCGKHGCDGGDGCGGKHDWNRYARDTFKNVFHRCHPTAHKCGHKFDGCGSCSTPCGKPGCGGCAQAPVQPEANPVMQTSYPRRER